MLRDLTAAALAQEAEQETQGLSCSGLRDVEGFRAWCSGFRV